MFSRRFYDFYTHPMDSITRFAYIAKKYGYSGIAVFNSPITKYIENKPENFSIYEGMEISCKPSMKDEIKKHKTNIILVRGGDEKQNRIALKNGIDILMQPIEFNHVLARIAYDNSIAIGFDIGCIIKYRGYDRVKTLRIMRTNLKYVRKYNLSMILTSNSYTCYDLRSPREMVALANLFGMTKEEAVDAMSTFPLEIVRRKSPSYVQEGVEII